MLAIQAMGYQALVGLGLGLLISSRKLPGVWLRSVWRARWLLLSLWLIFAYNTPGEAWLDLSWAPTHEGMTEAGLHALRLVLMLGALSWVHCRLGRDKMVSGLWGLLQPLKRWGVDAGRLVLRLSLVLDNMQNPPRKDDWKRMLAGEAWDCGPEFVQISLPRWSSADSLVVLAGGLLFFLATTL